MSPHIFNCIKVFKNSSTPDDSQKLTFELVKCTYHQDQQMYICVKINGLKTIPDIIGILVIYNELYGCHPNLGVNNWSEIESILNSEFVPDN